MAMNSREGQISASRISLKNDIKKNKAAYLMLLPYYLLFTVMIIIPILVSVVLSFTYYNMFEPPQFNGLTNYISLFLDDDVFYIALKNTLIFAIVTGPFSYFLCFVIAWFINDLGKHMRVALTVIFYAPSMCSSVYFIWQFIFSGDAYGFINSLLMRIGIIMEPIQWLTDASYTLSILILVQIWMSLGTGFLSFIAGFQAIDRSIYEAGSIDGVHNRFQELIYLTVPMMKPQMVFGAIMQISASFAVSTVSMQLCGFPSTNYSAHTLVLHIMDYASIRYDMGYACTVSVILFVLTMFVKKGIDLLMRYIKDDS